MNECKHEIKDLELTDEVLNKDDDKYTIIVQLWKCNKCGLKGHVNNVMYNEVDWDQSFWGDEEE